MVYGVIVFSAEGSSPLFSTFFTPEGNDEHMQKRQQGVIRKVVEDRLFQVQCSRDVLLASRSPDINSPIDDPLSSTTGLGGGGASQSLLSSSSASLAFSSPSSFSSFNDIPRRKQRPNRDRKRINQERKAGEGRSASSAPGVDPHTPEFKSHANGISSSMEIAQGMAGGGVYTPGDDWRGKPPRERRRTTDKPPLPSSSSSSGVHAPPPGSPSSSSFSPSLAPSASLPLGGASHSSLNPSLGLDSHGVGGDSSFAMAVANEKAKQQKRQEEAEEAMAIASSEVLHGLFLLQPSSLFSSPKLVLWKHVESISYVLICGSMENILLGFSFLTLFINCLFEILHVNLPNPNVYPHQLAKRPDAILLVLHYLLPGGHLTFINTSLAKYLKSQIKTCIDMKGHSTSSSSSSSSSSLI